MNDLYAEFMIKRKTPAIAYILRCIMVLLCIISVFMALTTVIGVILMTVSVIFTYFIFRNTNVEYEYVYVTNQLTIDKIMGQAARKKAWEGVMDNIQIIAPSDSYLIKDYETTSMKILNFSSNLPEAKTYSLIHQFDGKTEKIIFEPNDKLLQCFKVTSPRKVVI